MTCSDPCKMIGWWSQGTGLLVMLVFCYCFRDCAVHTPFTQQEMLAQDEKDDEEMHMLATRLQKSASPLHQSIEHFCVGGGRGVDMTKLEELAWVRVSGNP